MTGPPHNILGSERNSCQAPQFLEGQAVELPDGELLQKHPLQLLLKLIRDGARKLDVDPKRLGEKLGVCRKTLDNWVADVKNGGPERIRFIGRRDFEKKTLSLIVRGALALLAGGGLSLAERRLFLNFIPPEQRLLEEWAASLKQGVIEPAPFVLTQKLWDELVEDFFLQAGLVEPLCRALKHEEQRPQFLKNQLVHQGLANLVSRARERGEKSQDLEDVAVLLRTKIDASRVQRALPLNCLSVVGSFAQNESSLDVASVRMWQLTDDDEAFLKDKERAGIRNYGWEGLSPALGAIEYIKRVTADLDVEQGSYLGHALGVAQTANTALAHYRWYPEVRESAIWDPVDEIIRKAVRTVP